MMKKTSAADFARQHVQYYSDRELCTEFKRINYVLRGDGLWEIRKNRIATFYSHLLKKKIAGFDKDDETYPYAFELHVPKVPRVLFNQAVAFFAKLCKKHDFEAYVQFYYNQTTQEYWVNVPNQKVSKIAVNYEAQTGVSNDNLLVCEIHSHNSMKAFFSATDDTDEKKRGDRFFGVVGELDKALPTYEMSFIIGGGDRVLVNLEDVVEPEETCKFPTEWLQKIETISPKKNVGQTKVYNSTEWLKTKAKKESDWEGLQLMAESDLDFFSSEGGEPMTVWEEFSMSNLSGVG